MTTYDIGTDETFTWRVRLEIERRLRNVTAAHKGIIEHTATMADADHSELTHGEIAATLGYGKRTVGEALRRARRLGLLDWRAQYEPRPGSVLCWRKANIYRRSMPQGIALPCPNVRRHDGGTLCRARKQARKAAYEQGRATVDLLAARRNVLEERQRLLLR